MDGIRKPYQQRLKELSLERESFIAHYRELMEHFTPRRGKFLDTGQNKGGKKHNKIIDAHALFAVRTLASGMMAGMTSPARPWFRLGVPDPSLAEYEPVRDWLHTVERRMRQVFASSNFYQVMPSYYREIGVFGTASMLVVDDLEDVVNFVPQTVGEYYIANDRRLRVDTMYRAFKLTVRQLVQEFGLGNVSASVKHLYEKGAVDQWIDVVHCIETNMRTDAGSPLAKDMPVKSVYYESSGDSDKLLRESGFETFPVLAARWDVVGTDPYGSDCPGMDALGMTKGLQFTQKQKYQGIEKSHNPPLIGPSSLKNARVSALPGHITYSDVMNGQSGLQPLYKVDPRVDLLLGDIDDTRRQIDKAFFVDLFLMLSNSNRRQITAREIDERHEEKLLMLGPVLERLQNELLDPTIDAIFHRMQKAGHLPPPPQELMGQDLKVDYISVMAQAQKMAATAGIERFAGFVGNLAGTTPEALDRLNVDAAIEEYGDAMGISPNVILSKEEAGKIRQGRAQAQQQAMQQQAAQQEIAGAKTLSEIDTSKENGLTGMLQQLKGAS
ncbi:MAG: phage tail protein [Magnetococcales bacterium]|nr:phage tail protein [Magnetococcales bacterium]